MKASILILLLVVCAQVQLFGQAKTSAFHPSDELLELGRKAAEQNKHSDAVALLCTFIANYPNHSRVPDALEHLGKVYHSQYGKRDELIGCLRKLTELGEGNPHYRIAMNWIETHQEALEWAFGDAPTLVRAAKDQEIKVKVKGYLWQRPHLPTYRLYRIPPDEVESEISNIQTNYSVELNGGKASRERWETKNIRAELSNSDPNKSNRGFGWASDICDKLYADFSGGGIFVLEQEIEGFSERSVINAPAFGLFCKVVGDRTLVYAADVWSGQPIENLDIELWSDRSGMSRRTNVQGVVSFPRLDQPPLADPSEDDYEHSLYVVARRGNDIQACAVEPLNLPQAGSRAFITTDRPIYRPSQTVHYKVVVRDLRENKLALPPHSPLRVEIRGPQGRLVQTQEFQLSEFGSISGSFRLADEPALGNYQIIAHVPRPLTEDDLDSLDYDWEKNWSQAFEVAEYRKPEFEVTIQPQGDWAVPGEQIKATVNAQYYFGGAAKNADVDWTVVAYPAAAPNLDHHQYSPFEDPRAWFVESHHYSASGWSGGFLSHDFYSWSPTGESIASGEGRTNDQGELEVVFDSKSADEPVKYKLMATVRDASRMTAQGSAEIESQPAPYIVTVGTPRLFYEPGEAFEAMVRVKTRDGKPVANRQIKLSAFLQVSETSVEREFESFFNEEIETDNQGLAVAKIVAAESGRLRLRAEVRPEKGNPAVARSEIWIAGEAAVDQDESLVNVSNELRRTPEYQGFGGGLFSIPSVAFQFGGGFSGGGFSGGGFGGLTSNDDGFDLALDTDLLAYRHGEKIRLMVRTLEKDVNALLLIEGDQIYLAKAVRLSKRCEILEIPVTADFPPLVRITLLAWSGGKFDWSGTEVSVYPDEKFLNIAVATEQPSYAPRQQSRISLHVTDAGGKPVRAEVELGIVDESLFDLAEDQSLDIRSFFFPRPAALKYLSVASVSIPAESLYANIGDLGGLGGGGFGGGMVGFGLLGGAQRPFVTSAIPVLGGGMGGGAGGAATAGNADTELRNKFADTFYWSAHVMVGDDGKADLKIEVPDTLGQWRIVVRAISGSEKFGLATSKVITRKEAIVRLSAPRFFTQGDRATVSTVVNNETDQEARFLVTLECEGAKAGGEQTRIIPAKGQVRVDWPIEVDGIGTVKLRAKALSPIASDAMELTLPVRPYGIEKWIALNGRLEKSTWNTTLVIPEDAAVDSAKLQIVVSSPSIDAVREALPYLADYPYGCVEQTMSRFLPAAVAASAMKRQGIENEGLAAKLPDMVEQGLQRLYGFQHDDGGWGWWKNDKTNEFMTTYVVFGLLTAQKAGYEIDSDTLQRGIDAVHAQPATPFSVYVLKLANADADFELDNIRNQPQEKPAANDPFGGENDDPFGDTGRQLSGGQVFVALHAARQTANRRFTAEELAFLVLAGYQDLADQLPTEPPKSSGPAQVRTTALLIRALASIDRDDPRIPPLVEWLMRQRRGGAWYSTLDTAYAVFALSELAQPGNDNPSIEVVINGQRKESPSGRISILPADLRQGANRIEIRQTDDEPLVFASVLLNYFSTSLDTQEPENANADQATEQESALRIHRIFERSVTIDGERQWQPIESGGKITINDELRVTTIVKAPDHVERVMIESALPAGTEPHVDEIADEEYWDNWFGRRELRDDRVSIAASHIYADENRFQFRLRPTHPGHYRVLPAKAFPMYDPDHQAHSAPFLIEIVDAD